MPVTKKQALAFVERHGLVLQAARGPVPNLAEEVAGGPIRGSWWGHPRGHEIFALATAVSESPEVLVCTLVEGRITYVHRRLWPALVKLARRLGTVRLARVWDEHTATGAHRSRREPFPRWVPADVRAAAQVLTVVEAEEALAPWPFLLDARSASPRRASGRSRPRGGSTGGR